MTDRHDQAMAPGIGRPGIKRRMLIERLGGQTKGGIAMHHKLGYLLGIALEQLELHRRKLGSETGQHGGQHIARLSVGGRNRQGARMARGKLLADFSQRRGLIEHAFGSRQNLLTRLGQLGIALAVSHEELHAELFFELTDLLGQRRLRGEQHLGRRGEVQPPPDGFTKRAQLLEVHALPKIGLPSMRRVMTHCWAIENRLLTTQ